MAGFMKKTEKSDQVTNQDQKHVIFWPNLSLYLKRAPNDRSPQTLSYVENNNTLRNTLRYTWWNGEKKRASFNWSTTTQSQQPCPSKVFFNKKPTYAEVVRGQPYHSQQQHRLHQLTQRPNDDTRITNGNNRKFNF